MHRLNYVYFGTLFILIALLHVVHVHLVKEGSAINHLFYTIYAIGQCLLEVGALVLIGALVSEKALFVIGTFVLLIIHLIDFSLTRIMDMSIWYSFSIVLAESFDNFIEMLKASNIELQSWLWMGLGVGAMALMGLFLFRIAGRFSARKPFYFSYRSASIFMMTVMGALFLLDYQLSPIAAAKEDGNFLKTLPWKTTLFTKAYPRWTLSAPLGQRPKEDWHQQQLKTLAIQPKSRPNIYLFIAESMREDFITQEVAPTLSQFREKEISFSSAISGANATNLSWFSIFHSVYPFAWGDRKEWSSGSVPLQMFKKAGYQIHVLSASGLNFYQMDTILFGKDHALADDFQLFADGNASHCQDAKCVDTLIEKMQTHEEGCLFIVFLEGTHFDYSWPPELVLPQRPISQAIDYLRITYSQNDLEGIKNRYRHAIYHVDKQFHRFLTALKSHPKQEEAVVVFTSDHGEEFFEEGRIFHASNLNRAQTRVPLYYRLPAQKAASTFTSHLDIFPTLLDHVLGSRENWFDGESILRTRQKPFAITTRFNASRTPYEFLITTEDELLITRFEKRMDVKGSKALEIVSRKDKYEKPLDTALETLQQRYQKILYHLSCSS